MKKRKVVFYGRVSTQSDEQLSAFDNQMAWYQLLLAQHPEWEVVEEYEDAGVTGTSVRKRKGFQQMMTDGIQFHKFDLIVTRETKRFARNTVDALSYVRLLKQNGIEVYFVSDGIWTISDNDGELRLSIMATIAQEESRKTSENVRAGQRISRQKGILRGSGNILGYRRVGRNQYEIDPDQAIIVKEIYRWYLGGDGIRVIKRKLEERGYKTATGKSTWQYQAIANILKNPFYTGKQLQLRKVSDGYLTQKRVNNSPDKMEYIKGCFEPIISEEVFEEVRRIRERRYRGASGETKGQMDGQGRRESRSAWSGKYLCGCGCGTIRRTAGGEESIFICHSQHIYGIQKRSKHDGAEGLCSLRSMLEWKLDMIAYHVLNDVWKSRGEDIKHAIKIMEECRKEEASLSLEEIQIIKTKIDKLENRKQSLLDMRADGEITKKEYTAKRLEYDNEIAKLNTSIMETRGGQAKQEAMDTNSIQQALEQTLEQMLDLTGPKLRKEIIDESVWRLVHVSNNEFDIYLSMGNDNFGSEGAEVKIIKSKVFEYPESRREERIQCTLLKTLRLTYEDAVKYRTMNGKRVLKNKWEDLVVHIYV